MMTNSSWPCLEPDVETILALESNPIQSIASGEVPAVVIRQAFPREECAALVDLLLEEELIFPPEQDDRIDETAIPAVDSDRWTRAGINPAQTKRRRIDIGTSLGHRGGDKQDFLARSVESNAMFDRLFAERPDPIATMYDHLRAIAPEKQVAVASEPDGRQYGRAIFRVHYGGYTYGPHFDSVRQREKRTDYSVFKYEHQIAGVLCVQNTTLGSATAQGIIHRQFWNEEVDPYLKSGRFYNYASTHSVERVRVELDPGDLYFFNTSLIHEVPGVEGELPRIVLATFIGYSESDDTVVVWS